MGDSRYAVCEEYEVPIVDENFDKFSVPIIAPNFRWSLYVGNTGSLLFTSIYLSNEDRNYQYGIHYSTKILNQLDPENSSEGVDRRGVANLGKFLHGDDMNISEVLDEENGFLRNGVIKVRVCFHIESFIEVSRAPVFNFAYPHFDYLKKGHTLRLEWVQDSAEVSYVHHQPVKLHSKVVSDMYGKTEGNICLLVPSNINFDYLVMCLQIMHGVFLEYFYADLLIETAFTFQMKNVVSLMERQLIEVEKYRREFKDLIMDAIKYRMERLLKCLLRDMKSFEEFKNFLPKTTHTDISSESMKSVIARFLAYD